MHLQRVNPGRMPSARPTSIDCNPLSTLRSLTPPPTHLTAGASATTDYTHQREAHNGGRTRRGGRRTLTSTTTQSLCGRSSIVRLFVRPPPCRNPVRPAVCRAQALKAVDIKLNRDERRRDRMDRGWDGVKRDGGSAEHPQQVTSGPVAVRRSILQTAALWTARRELIENRKEN